MIFPTYARYSKVMFHVNNFLAEENILSFPIDPYQIIKNNKWGFITYSELAQEHGVWIEDIINAFQSEDGYTIFDGANYTIAYNDTIQSKGRIRFTLLHEIGHIYLRHLIDFDETVLTRSTLTDHKYRVLENEANSFARNILAPVILVRELNLKSIHDLVKFFEISKAAANIRLKYLSQDIKYLLTPYKRFQTELFEQFIYSSLNTRYCVVCGHNFISEDAEFCPICGYHTLINKKGDNDMIYKGFLLDDTSCAHVCPRCENELLSYEGDICKICGIDLVNKCTSTYRSDDTGWNYTQESCNTLLDGDARYCVKCGNESTFYQQGLLKNWQEEKEEIEFMKELDNARS
jgi:Zn-dependent peptidase ImmA (M78 family)/RNA polymerase subunit RPABC4/transcription elongation factor Spt4